MANTILFVPLLREYYVYHTFKANVKQSLYRALGFQNFQGPKFTDNGHMMLVRLSALNSGRLYPDRKYFYVLISVTANIAAGWIKSVTPSGIETATFRLVAQCLKQLCHCVPFTKPLKELLLLSSCFLYGCDEIHMKNT
jgi:hypothetical protein